MTSSRELRETCELPVEWADPTDAMRKSGFPTVAGTDIGTTALKTGRRINVAGGASSVELYPR